MSSCLPFVWLSHKHSEEQRNIRLKSQLVLQIFFIWELPAPHQIHVTQQTCSGSTPLYFPGRWRSLSHWGQGRRGRAVQGQTGSRHIDSSAAPRCSEDVHAAGLLSRLVPALRSDRLHGKLHRYKNLPLFCPRHTLRERCGRGTTRKHSYTYSWVSVVGLKLDCAHLSLL